MIDIHSVMAPADFSAHSEESVRYACGLAERLGAELFMFAPASKRGVDGVQVVLSNQVDLAALRAMIEQARALKLPLFVRTSDAHEVEQALSAGANAVENGSVREKLAESLFAQMKTQGMAYIPGLTAVEGLTSLINGGQEPLERPWCSRSDPRRYLVPPRNSFNRKKPPNCARS